MSIRAKLQAEGYESEHLDELVLEAAEALASATNNDGMKAQIEFLENRGWSEDQIMTRLSEL